MSEYFFIRGYDDFKRPGVIPESFVEKAYGFYERRGAPFLQEIKKARHEIYYDGQVLHLGEPEMRPEVPTWREYLLKYEGYVQKDLRKTNLRKITSQVDYEDLDTRMCCEYFCDQWARKPQGGQDSGKPQEARASLDSQGRTSRKGSLSQ